MFSISDQAPTSFLSSWKNEESHTENSMQTDPIQNSDKHSQVFTSLEVGTQTDDEKNQSLSFGECDDERVLKFLKRIVPHVEKELEKSNRSRAFDSFLASNDEVSSAGKLAFTFKLRDISKDLVVLGVDWNAHGSALAVCYGVSVHDDWCDHKGILAVWNVNRRDISQTDPDFLSEISTCASCLAFHPSELSIIALGNQAGEVSIYDLSRSESGGLPIMTGFTEGHAVTCLKWASFPTPASQATYKHFQNAMSLVSTTDNGVILVWSVSRSKNSIKIASGFFVNVTDVSRGSISGGRSSRASNGVSVSDLAVSTADPASFLIATDTGAILVCSALLSERADVKVCGIDLNKCVTACLAPHTGRVTSVSTSTFHPHAALSIGSDKTVNLHSILQPYKPVRTIHSEEGLTCGLWVPSRALVWGAGQEDGRVVFLSLAEAGQRHVHTIPAAEKAAPVSSLALTCSGRNLVACGDHLGRVFVWELPEHVVSASSTEQAVLASMLAAALD